jgi:mannose-6-phosphate isomerase
MAFALSSIPKNYDWGVQDAMSRFMGIPGSGKPEAEVWWGNHPLSESKILLDGHVKTFSDFLAETQQDFPLLVKLLAAAKPLSIQVHPDEKSAHLGFVREEEGGIPLDSPSRTYKDPSSKPEMLIALADDFFALAGFLEEGQTRERLSRWASSGLPDSVLGFFGDPYRGHVVVVPELVDPNVELEHITAAFAQWIRALDGPVIDFEASTEAHILRRIADGFPGDPGLLFAPLMHHVRLARGEGLFVPPGEVHAYVGGVGLEVMLPSDNVLRAGLTTKPKDGEEFLKLANLEGMDSARIISPSHTTQGGLYQPPGMPFEVSHLENTRDEMMTQGPAMCVIEAGSLIISNSSGTQNFDHGQAVFLLPGEALRLAESKGSVWIVNPKDV